MIGSTTSRRAVLSFYSQLGEVVRFSIPRARLDKTTDEARNAMDAIIATNAVTVGGGHPQSIHGAKIIQTVREQWV